MEKETSGYVCAVMLVANRDLDLLGRVVLSTQLCTYPVPVQGITLLRQVFSMLLLSRISVVGFCVCVCVCVCWGGGGTRIDKFIEVQ